MRFSPGLFSSVSDSSRSGILFGDPVVEGLGVVHALVVKKANLAVGIPDPCRVVLVAEIAPGRRIAKAAAAEAHG